LTKTLQDFQNKIGDFNIPQKFLYEIFHVDAISLYFYNYDQSSLYQGIMQFMTIGKNYGFTGDYLITEIGNPTGGFYPWRVSMEKLAENVIKSSVIATAFQIKTLFWYCMKDSEDEHSDPRNSENYFGLLDSNNNWKKGAYAYRLFSKYCSNSEICQDLLKKEGGIDINDIMCALYRKKDGSSALIIWYDPTLYESKTLKITLDIPDTIGNVIIHDIYSGARKILNDNSIEISDTPIFLTFQADSFTDFLTIHVNKS